MMIYDLSDHLLMATYILTGVREEESYTYVCYILRQGGLHSSSSSFLATRMSCSTMALSPDKEQAHKGTKVVVQIFFDFF